MRVYGTLSALRGTFCRSRVVENACRGHIQRNLVQLACDDGLIKFVLARRRSMSAFGGKADVREVGARCPLMTQSGHPPVIVLQRVGVQAEAPRTPPKAGQRSLNSVDEFGFQIRFHCLG